LRLADRRFEKYGRDKFLLTENISTLSTLIITFTSNYKIFNILCFHFVAQPPAARPTILAPPKPVGKLKIPFFIPFNYSFNRRSSS